MPVTVQSSQAFLGAAQKDRRFYVREVFNLSNGQAVEGIYIAPEGYDTDTHLSNRAIQIIADMTQAEIDSNVAQVVAMGSLATPTLGFSTPSDNFVALRVAYATSTQLQAIMIGDYLSTLTNGQLASAFGITTGQAATLRTNKLAPAASIATSIRAAAGQ